MPKFTFIGEHTDLYGNPDGTKLTYEFEVDTLDSVLEHVDLFIRGCGYVPTGTLDYAEDIPWQGNPNVPEWNVPSGAGSSEPNFGGAGHSNYFFDTERNK